GPGLRLVVRFLRPQFVAVERSSDSDAVRNWSRVSQELPTQHAALRIAGTPPHVVRVCDLPYPERTPALEEYTQASMRANCQSREEVAATMRWRRDQVERLVGGRSSALEEMEDDGSIA